MLLLRLLWIQYPGKINSKYAIGLLVFTFLTNSLLSQQLTVTYEDLPTDPFAVFAQPVGMAILKFEGLNNLDQEIFNAIKKIPAIRKSFELFPYQVLQPQMKKWGIQLLDPSDVKVRKILRDKLEISIIMTGKVESDGGFLCVFKGTSNGKKLLELEFKPSINSNPLTDLVKLLSENKKPKYVEEPRIQSDMVFVEGGAFQMGSSEYDDEKPIHTVSITKSFYIGKYEVTQKQWQDVMGNNPSNFKGDNLPVENVSWNDVQEFIRRFNQRQGSTKYRLPTEAEWEYAARGGNKSRGYIYSGSNNFDDVAWNMSNSNSQTHQVRTKQPNELGLYDMSGNVWELCADRYDANYYVNSSSNSPQGPNSGKYRVSRGGSWYSIDINCRVPYRGVNLPDDRSNYNGCRLLREN
jgi:formylglycine-generating enzyme required for sulfatase activity